MSSLEKKTNPWIEHCKDYAKKHNVKYSVAIKEAKLSYVKPEKVKNSKPIEEPETIEITPEPVINTIKKQRKAKKENILVE